MNQFEFKTHTIDTTSIPYRLFIPKINDENSYPLILALHGAGERGNDNKAQIKYHKLATVWADSANQEGHPCFVIAPQCPKNERWVDSNWDVDTFDFKSTSISNELATVYDLIEKMISEYPIDKERIYITGLSMGGFGTWYMLMKYPKLFAAAIPMSGGGDPQMVSEIKNIPIWNFHGDLDKAVPVEASRVMINALDKCGSTVLNIPNPNSKDVLENEEQRGKILQSNLIYTEYKNKGHVIWKESYENPLVREWLFSKRLK
ncbi:MAG: prolyl oligopeptidase family serine peptidase [Bacteroidota bacterium]